MSGEFEQFQELDIGRSRGVLWVGKVTAGDEAGDEDRTKNEEWE